MGFMGKSSRLEMEWPRGGRSIFQGYTWMVLFLDISSRINFAGRFKMKGYFSSSFPSDYATSKCIRRIRFICAISFSFFPFQFDNYAYYKRKKSEISNEQPINSSKFKQTWKLDVNREIVLDNLRWPQGRLSP